MQGRLGKSNGLIFRSLWTYSLFQTAFWDLQLVSSFSLGKLWPELFRTKLSTVFATLPSHFKVPYRLKQMQAMLWGSYYGIFFDHTETYTYCVISESQMERGLYLYSTISLCMDDRTLNKLPFALVFLALTEMNSTLNYSIIFISAQY